MSSITIDLLCEECGTRGVATLPRDEATYEARWACDECGAPGGLKRVPSSPMVMKAAWPDGRKSKHKDALLEASRLEVEASSLPPEKRAGIKKEIQQLKRL